MPAGYKITDEQKKKIIAMFNNGMKYSEIASELCLNKSSCYDVCRQEIYRQNHRMSVFSFEEARKANQAIHRGDIDRLKRETYIGRTVVIKTKTYESDGIRATGMTGIDEKWGKVCAIYRNFFSVIMEEGGYRTSFNWADMLSYHADYDISFAG